MMQHIAEELNIEPNLKVLNMGAGTGNFEKAVALKFSDVIFTAVDSSEQMLSIARKKCQGAGNIHFIDSDIGNFLSENNEYDRIISSNVLYTLEDPETILNRLFARLKPGGIMVHTTPKENFSPLKIFLEHCRKCNNFSTVISTAIVIPSLIIVGFLNIFIVNEGKATQKFWGKKEFEGLFQIDCLKVLKTCDTYGGQDWLIVCKKETQ
jgi:2-polyprenyl-3-methyl-5-hydroxy-6-metoxy-1,4-benzoquinol methylase